MAKKQKPELIITSSYINNGKTLEEAIEKRKQIVQMLIKKFSIQSCQ